MITLARTTRPTASAKRAETQRALTWARQCYAAAVADHAGADELADLRTEVKRLEEKIK